MLIADNALSLQNSRRELTASQHVHEKNQFISIISIPELPAAYRTKEIGEKKETRLFKDAGKCQ